MKSILGSLLFLALTSANALQADDSHQGQLELSKWSGRSSANQTGPHVLVSTDDQGQKPGTPYLTVKTDGNLGSGLEFPPDVPVVPGSPCLLTFWLKTSNATPITYRITDASRQKSNESIDTWHSAPGAANNWVQVRYLFFPTSSLAGLEVAAGGAHDPTELSISDPRIVPSSVDATNGAHLDFSSLGAAWHGRPSPGGAIPAVTVSDSGAPEDGKAYLTIQTDGKLGCGFQLDPLVNVTPGKSYLLTYWVKTSAPIPLSFRISGANGREYAEDGGTWHTATSSINAWVKGEYRFTPAAPYLGLEIGAGSSHSPCAFSIANVALVPAP